jgi:hypothetical protein
MELAYNSVMHSCSIMMSSHPLAAHEKDPTSTRVCGFVVTLNRVEYYLRHRDLGCNLSLNHINWPYII